MYEGVDKAIVREQSGQRWSKPLNVVMDADADANANASASASANATDERRSMKRRKVEAQMMH